MVTVNMMNHFEERTSSRNGRPLEALLSGDSHFVVANMINVYILLLDSRHIPT